MKGKQLKSVLAYGLAIAAGVFVLEWTEYRYAVRAFTSEIYVGGIAIVFLVLGVFMGAKLFGSGKAPSEPDASQVERLGISERELEVLQLVAEGLSNGEIGERLFVSPNTVKTHVANLFRKLEVSRRTQAVRRARNLRILV